MTQATEAPARDRARIAERTLRKDPWWRQPAINATALAVVVVYLTWASLVNGNYFWEPYISPLYSPCLATTCTPGSGFDWIPWLTWLSPAIIIIGGPTGFRLTCYYYRKAYSLSCHACRHAVGGRLKHFSKHPVRYWMWTQVSKLNAKHMQFAWISLG